MDGGRSQERDCGSLQGRAKVIQEPWWLCGSSSWGCFTSPTRASPISVSVGQTGVGAGRTRVWTFPVRWACVLAMAGNWPEVVCSPAQSCYVC